MNWADLAAVVGKSAPLLGTVLGGPAGGAIGGIVAAALGAGGTADEVSAAIAADPQAALKLREIELAHQVQLQGLALESMKAELAGVADARARDVALVGAGRYNIRADVLSALAVGGLVFCVWLVARDANLPERAVNAIMFVAGVLASCARDVYGFEFGSSRSSQTKDATISNLSK